MNKRTPKEIEHEMMLKALNKFKEFAGQYTNVTVLKCQGEEADDMINRFVICIQKIRLIIIYIYIIGEIIV